MPQEKMNAAKLQREMATGTAKAYNRDQAVGLMKDIDRIMYLQRENQDIPQPRRNKDYVNQRDGAEYMPFSTKTVREERIDRRGERAAREVNASRIAAQNASGRPPRRGTTVAKPLSAAKGAKMVGAMAGKQPVSPMRSLLKIK